MRRIGTKQGMGWAEALGGGGHVQGDGAVGACVQMLVTGGEERRGAAAPAFARALRLAAAVEFVAAVGFMAVLVVAAGLLPLAGCGENAAGEHAGQSYCQDMAGTYHFQVFAPPWKYVREYKCTDGDFKNCNKWEPTGGYVFVVTDVPYVSYDSEIVDLLRVEFLAGQDALSAMQGKVAEIRSDGQAVLLPRSDGADYAEVTTESDMSGYDVFWTQVREHDGQSFNWYRRDVYLDGAGGAFHLEMFSIEPMDRLDFDALIRSFTQGPAPEVSESCRCMDELADPPVPCQE